MLPVFSMPHIASRACESFFALSLSSDFFFTTTEIHLVYLQVKKMVIVNKNKNKIHRYWNDVIDSLPSLLKLSPHNSRCR